MKLIETLKWRWRKEEDMEKKRRVERDRERPPHDDLQAWKALAISQIRKKEPLTGERLPILERVGDVPGKLSFKTMHWWPLPGALIESF